MMASFESTNEGEPECVAKISPNKEHHQKNPKIINNKRAFSCELSQKDLQNVMFLQNFNKKNTFKIDDIVKFKVSDSEGFVGSIIKITAPIKKSEKAEFYAGLEKQNKKDAVVKVFNGANKVDIGEREKKTLLKLENKLLNSKVSKNFCHMLGFCVSENGNYSIAIEKGQTTVFEELKKCEQVPFPKIKEFSIQMLRLFNSFQKIGLLYRNMTPEHIQIFNNKKKLPTFKISEFEVAEWLDFDLKSSIFTKELELSGDPIWMSPENYSFYKNNIKNDQNSSNDDFSQFSPNFQSAVRNDIKSPLVLAMKKTSIQDETILITVNIEESYKSDVFSLGLVILALALGVNHCLMKEVFEKNEQATKKAIKFFKNMEKPQNCKFLDSLIENMLSFDVKERKDFKTIFKSHFNETPDEIAETNESLNLRTIQTSKIENFPKFTESVLRRILEKGYLTEELNKKFVVTVLKNIWRKNAYNNFIQEELSAFPKLFEIIEKNYGKFEKLVKIYASDLNFFKPLNQKLSKNEIDLYKFFVVSLLQKRPLKIEQNLPKKVYRLVKSKKGGLNTNAYIKGEGKSFYWNSYSSTTKDKEIAKKWIEEEDSDYILFEIELEETNFKNKIDISEISDYEEKEILLLPYFYFTVIKCSSFTVKINGKEKEVLKIKVKELKTQIFNFKIVWLDENINSENVEIQQNIKKQCGKNTLIPMEKVSHAIDYINSQNEVCIAISSGKMKKKFIDKIYNSEKVAYFLIYASQKEKHEAEVWAKNKEKVVGVCVDEAELMERLPKRKYLY